LSEQQKLWDEIQKYDHPYLWWSNAFFTVFSNWFFSMNQRKAIYEQWIEGLVMSNPNCRINGSDHNNSGVNGVTAAKYLEQYKSNPPTELSPVKINEIEICY